MLRTARIVSKRTQIPLPLEAFWKQKFGDEKSLAGVRCNLAGLVLAFVGDSRLAQTYAAEESTSTLHSSACAAGLETIA
jgi:hypothetical protein